MKKIIVFMLVLLSSTLCLSSCSKDDDINLSKESVIGTWDVTWAEMDGESLDVPAGYVYITLNNDGTYKVVMFSDRYSGTYKIEGNTVIGTTLDPITEYFKFTKLEGDNAEIDYSNSEEDFYKFKATKR
ncbi:MAG: glycoside hydrolase family 43 C-terminal domain-containing protein [Parabacteroides sp.]|nr:glycoside hydrolase family 43 C-terminal domain-containing protein [Parabacteroides sp.]